MIRSKANGKQYMSIEEFTRELVGSFVITYRFNVREIADKYNHYAWNIGREMRKPYDDTIGRILRRMREEGLPVNYFDKSKAIWWASDHIATKEERELYKTYKLSV